MGEGVILFESKYQEDIQIIFYHAIPMLGMYSFIDKKDHTTALVSYDLEGFLKRNFNMILSQEQIKKYEITVADKEYYFKHANFSSAEKAQLFLDEVILPNVIANKLAEKSTIRL